MPQQIVDELVAQGVPPDEAVNAAYGGLAAPLPPLPPQFPTTMPEYWASTLGPLVAQAFQQAAGAEQAEFEQQQAAAFSQGLDMAIQASLAQLDPMVSGMMPQPLPGEFGAPDASAAYAEGALPPVEPTGMVGF